MPDNTNYILLKANDNPDWDDDPGKSYHYGTGVNHSTKIIADSLLLLSKKRPDKKYEVFATATVDHIEEDGEGRKKEYRAIFKNYNELPEPIQLTGSLDRRTIKGINLQNSSITPITKDYYLRVLNGQTFIDSMIDYRAGQAATSFDISLSIVASLLAKRFVIISGLAGSGKTQQAIATARWLTKQQPINSNSQISVVSVGADWTSREAVFGYPDGLDNEGYVRTQSLDLILEAANQENRAKPYFLILDEMNLSHVERYFSDVLSALESKTSIQLHCDPTNKRGVPSEIRIPDNLFIIGTINVDETTYQFSPKVLDRANVVEFRMNPEAFREFLESGTSKPNLDILAGAGSFYGADFVSRSSQELGKYANINTNLRGDTESRYAKEMYRFFDIFKNHNREFGYRVGYESARFIAFYELLKGDEFLFEDAFDLVVLQKLLPKLNGSRAQLGELLEDLKHACLPPTETDKDEQLLITGGIDPIYRLSSEKLQRMINMLESGFTSFSEA